MGRLLSLILCLFLIQNALSQKVAFGVLDSCGNVVVPLEYEDIEFDYFHTQYLAKKNGKWGILDSVGNEKIPFLYEKLRVGKYITYRLDNDTEGLMDLDGNILMSPLYESLCVLDSGLIEVRNAKFDSWGDNNTSGIINMQGDTLVPLEYEAVYPISNERFIVRKQYITPKRFSLEGLIDRQGNVIIPLEYTELYRSECGDFVCGKYEMGNDENGVLIGLVNEEYSILTSTLEKRNKFEYEEINYADDTIAVVKNNKKWGIIKLDGNDSPFLPFEYDEIETYRAGEGMAIVKDSLCKKALLSNGRFVTDFVYDELDLIRNSFSDSCRFLYSVQKEIIKDGESYNMVGIINEKGETVFPFLYDSQDISTDDIVPVNDNAFIIEKDSDGDSRYDILYGIVDKEDKTIFPFDKQKIQTYAERPFIPWGVPPTQSSISCSMYISSRLPIDEVLIKKDGLCTIMNIRTNKTIISGYPQVIEYHNGKYIVGQNIEN